MEITPQTNINALLEAYPRLESYLMGLNPKYKKLKNPILRRTVARIASLSQVAKIGGYDPVELTNLIRKELGQPPLGENDETKSSPETEEQKPAWVNDAALILDAGALLKAEKNPLAEVRKAMKKLEPGQTLRLDTDFLPAPLIDTFKEDGIPVWTEKLSENEFHTWLLKR
jgi:uncharacterized protein (DUF2249 family)